MGDDHELTRAVREVVLASERYRLGVARQELGVGAIEMMALAHLFMEGPRTPGELGRRLQITSASVTELVDRLERAGSVRRAPHATDRRKVLVELTDHARERVSRSFDRYAGATTDCVAGLDDGERAVVLRFLTSVAAAYDAITPA